jgi:hypothetical protein
MQTASGDQSFVEYRDVTVTDPLRQGDILEATNEDANKWQRHLIVLTADCDFANRKNQGRVTCVPLLTQDEYNLEFQIPRISEKLIGKCTDALGGIIRSAKGPSISAERLRAWPLEQSADEIVEALGLLGTAAHDATRLISAIRAASNPPEDLDEAVQELIAASVNIPNGKQTKAATNDIVSSLTSHYSTPPGDTIFLSAVSSDMQDGYFVYLRHLEQIKEPDIILGPRRATAKYRRLARLHDRYIHAMSQQFALVFMSIGMPSDYEDMRKVHSQLLEGRYK